MARLCIDRHKQRATKVNKEENFSITAVFHESDDYYSYGMSSKQNQIIARGERGDGTEWKKAM